MTNKVMLVEDEIYARQGLRNLINWEDLGYEVSEEADNGEEALSLIEDRKPDVVITDIRMPLLDGLGLIRSVRESGNLDTKFIIISGYGDFKYAQQAIKFGVKDFILKPIDETELTDTLSHLAAQIKQDKWMKAQREGYAQSALGRLLHGEAAEEDVGSIARLLGLDPEDRYHYVIAELNGLPEPAHPDAEAGKVREYRRTIEKIACELGMAGSPLHLHEHRRGVFGFPLRLRPGEAAAAIQEKARRFADRLRQRLSLPVLVYVGADAGRLADIPRSYATACEAMQHKYAGGDDRVLAYESVRNQDLRYIEFTAGEYAKVLEQLEEGDRDAMLATVDWIFKEMRMRRFAPEAVQNAIARIAFGVIGSIRALRGDENEIRSLEAVLQWRERPLTLDGLRELFLSFVEESAELAARLRKTNAKGDIIKIKSYIEQHYHEEISLKSIAARFYMNPVYLGQLFKKTFGIYFNDFLLQLRIDHAKRLLRQTEMKVYEIARSVGFDNSDYFVCKFEKVEGKTPTAYRHELLAK